MTDQHHTFCNQLELFMNTPEFEGNYICFEDVGHFDFVVCWVAIRIVCTLIYQISTRIATSDDN